MRKLMLLMFALAVPGFAQVSGPAIVPTATTPTNCYNFFYALTTANPWTYYGPNTGGGCQALGTGTGGNTITSPNGTLIVGGTSSASTLDVANPVTFSNSNSGAASGATYNGSTASTISANTLGAPSLANANSFSAANTFTNTVVNSFSPTLTNYAIQFSGLPAIGTGGVPWAQFNTAGTQPTWSTTGAWLGFNCPASGVALDIEGHNNGGTQAWAVQCNGTGSFNGGIITTNITNTPATITYSATPTFNVGYSINRIVLTGNVTSSTLAAGGNGQRMCLLIFQDATGSHTFVAPTNMIGFTTIGATASKHNQQCFNYSTTDAAWEAESTGIQNF